MSRLRRLRQLWARIPQLDCKGLCWDSCGPVTGSRLELALMEQESGTPNGTREHPLNGEQMCVHLSPEGRCRIYNVRPTVCRLWGAVEAMPCHHGCQPVEGRLNDNDGMALLALSMKVGGDPVGDITVEQVDQMLALLASGRFEVRSQEINGRRSLTLIDRRRER